ncbi:MAG: type II toxin-antitoxin system HicB family antitoxin [Candidatus Micrarchaeota archaeon]
MKVENREFSVVIEKGEDGYFVGSVPELPGCYSQGKTKVELLKHMQEAIEGYLSVLREPVEKRSPFVGIERIKVKLPYGHWPAPA